MIDRKPKECRCDRARHTHGTPAAYHACGCRCYPCTNAAATRRTQNRRGETPIRSPRWVLPPIGSIRRLQALHAIGWTGAEIARRIGVSNQQITYLRSGECNTLPRTAEAIARVYDELWDKTPPWNTTTSRTINWARRLGFAVPLAWDDDAIDDPDAEPWHAATRGPRPWDYKGCGTPAAYRRHKRNGEEPCANCKAANRRDRRERRARAERRAA